MTHVFPVQTGENMTKTTKVMRVDCSSCNGCDIEMLATLATRYNLSHLNIEVTYQPEEANILVVTGGVNHKTAKELKKIYEKMKEPKVVVAMGTCALTKCVFQKGYSMIGPVDRFIPVTAYVFGCPPRPQNLLKAIISALGCEPLPADDFWKIPEEFRGMIKHDEEKCIGCGSCVEMCPSFAIRLEEDANRKDIVFNLAKCSYCGQCEEVCPVDAINLVEEPTPIYKDRNLGLLHGCMAREMCKVCGRFWHTEAQHRFIIKMLKEKGLGQEVLKKAEVTLSTCTLCKHNSNYITQTKKEMVQWALKGGES